MADVDAELHWDGGTTFRAQAGTAPGTTLDWDGARATSPVQALVLALASCMASDVVVILERGRTPPARLSVRAAATRAAKEPRRLTRVEMTFLVTGAVPADRVERALQLSRDTYCSVLHSLAKDIEVITSFEVRPAD
jgi:putative redox protein